MKNENLNLKNGFMAHKPGLFELSPGSTSMPYRTAFRWGQP